MNILYGIYIGIGFVGFIFLVSLFGLNIGLAYVKYNHPNKKLIVIVTIILEFLLSLVASIFWPIGFPLFLMYIAFEWGRKAKE